MTSYNPPSIANYNDNPPSDDGTQDPVNNLVSWARHISEIGDPLKAYGDAINNETESAIQEIEGRTFVNVKDPAYGAVGDGVADDTSAIQSAINQGPDITVYLPRGTYKTTSTLSISQEGTIILGDGYPTTTIQFEPNAADECIVFSDSASGVYFRGGVKGIQFYSSNTSVAKVGIKLVDTSGILLEDIGSTTWTDTGYNSRFLQTQGREFLTTRHLYIGADVGIQISQNPNVARNTVLDADHFDFHDTFITCTSGSTRAAVLVDDGVNMSNMTFGGANAWVRYGSHAFEWIDTSSTVNSYSLVFNNVRSEQGSDNTKYSFYISHNDTMKNITFINPYLDVNTNSYYFRNCDRITIIGGQSTTTGTALNVDNTCDDIKWINSQWQSGSTASVGTLKEFMTGKKIASGSPLAENGSLIAPAANTWQQQTLGMFDGELYSESVTLANDGTFDIPCSAAQGVKAGMVMVSAYDATNPYSIYGFFAYTPAGLVQINASANTSTTLGTASSFNFGHQGGSIFRIENKLGVTMDCAIWANYTF